MDKRRIREQNYRQNLQKQVEQAIARRANQSKSLLPSQYQQALQKPRSIVEKFVRKAIGPSKPVRPTKSLKNSIHYNPRMLLETPQTALSPALEYPTPTWFRVTGNVDVSVIVPLYKSQDVVQDLIHSWRINPGFKVEIIFIDDNCPNNSKEAVWRTYEKRHPQVPVGRILYNPENRGYGLACNSAAAFANGEFLIFLNADTTVKPRWIEPIVRTFREDSQVGIVGNLQLKEGGIWEGTIDGAGSQWCWKDQSFMHLGRHIYNHRHLPHPYRPDTAPKDMLEVSEREMVTGCCLAIRRDLFRHLGGFNPNYRIGYWEDADLCLTVREKGWKVMFQPESRIYHKLSHTGSGGHQFQDHNRNYFINKWINSARIDPLVEDKRTVPEVVSILLRRRAANGDVLVAAAVCPALKKKYPNAKIVFSTDCPEVLKGNPYIDRVCQSHEISERAVKLYYNLDMVYEYRPLTNILESYADAVGVSVSDCELFLASSALEGLPDNFIVMHAGPTAWVGRDWTAERFNEIARRLRQAGHRVVCVGKSSDTNLETDLDLRGKTTISQLAYLMQRAKLFVGIDSFPMHVAQTFELPAVCFFGSVNPETRRTSAGLRPVMASVPCLGCHHRQPIPCTVTNVCQTGTLECVHYVSVEQMWKEVEKCLV